MILRTSQGVMGRGERDGGRLHKELDTTSISSHESAHSDHQGKLIAEPLDSGLALSAVPAHAMPCKDARILHMIRGAQQAVKS